MTWRAKTYLLDGKPTSTQDIHKALMRVDEQFRESTWKQTKVAIARLRKLGHTIELNPDYKWQRP